MPQRLRKASRDMCNRVTLLSLVLLLVSSYTDASCQKIGNTVSCLYSIPNMEELKSEDTYFHVNIRYYNGGLYTAEPEGSMDHKVASIQIQKSSIGQIQPRFFSRFTGGVLSELVMKDVNGSTKVDSETFGGLENSLKKLRIMDHRLEDVSYVAQLHGLTELVLIRTGLTRFPDNIGPLLEHLKRLDLTGNQLTRLPWNLIAKRLPHQDFTAIQLGQNKWKCDCSMKPLIQAPLAAKIKVIDLNCMDPSGSGSIPFTTLKLEDICAVESDEDRRVNGEQSNSIAEPHSPTSELDGKPVYPDVVGSRDSHPGLQGTQGEESEEQQQLATAGGMSTEVIAVIVAVIVVVLIVLIAVIVFKVRSRNQRRRQQATNKQPSHKSNAYCHVIEHPTSKTGNNPARPSGAASAGPPSASMYARDMDHTERQPLAPPYYAQRDNRL
ncbi:hypothetical protein EG68_00954 [Paragonimus skrjabini miyazakii]|uniref:Uncharacterized protein n=1 Tax=Paragonimus skrjabini miyazakii TaxID=59628 RepID=A0A8S9ZCI5_9TREM|nr:hypothetical protein EG68_00954 [Paragonimus skrjabini miyazakii]